GLDQLQRPRGAGDFLCRLRSETTGEDGERSELALLLRREHPVAPVNGIAQGLVPSGRVARPRAKQAQPPGRALDAFGQLLSAQHPQARCRQLEGQRKAVERSTDARDRGSVVARDAEIWKNCPGALLEQHGRRRKVALLQFASTCAGQWQW